MINSTAQDIKAIQAQTMASLEQLEQRESKTVQGLKKLVSDLEEDEPAGVPPLSFSSTMPILVGLGVGLLTGVALASSFF